MQPLSVDEQDRHLRATCPEFKLVLNAGWIGIWEGPLTPICQTYRIRIVYFSRRLFDGWTLANPRISIIVVDPPIGPDPRGIGQPPQHVYRLGYPPEFPRLCIYDPQADEWSPDQYIADTIIPWTLKWLLFHEDWVATGKWKGGGRHPEVTEASPCPNKEDLSPAKRARQARSLNAAFHSLGRKIGVFASFPLMVAASGGSFPPLSWRDLSAPTPAEIRSHLTSILLQAPRRAEFSPSDWAQDSLRENSFSYMSSADARSSRLSPTMPWAA